MELSLQSVDQVLSIVTSLCTMQILKHVDVKEGNFMLYLRIVYGSALMLNFLFFFLIKKQILAKKDARILKIKNEPKFSLFKQEDEGNEDDAEIEVEITYEDYDLKELKKLQNAAILQGSIMSLLHYKYGTCQPLIIQSIAPLKAFFLNPLFLAHLRNKEMIRPFEKNLFFENKPAVVVEKKKKKED